MTHQPFVFDAAPVDVFRAVAAKVAHEWGDYGYSMNYSGRRGTQEHPYLFGVHHADGSEFYLASDRWSNVVALDWSGERFTEREEKPC